jgi:hypothetical protein
MLPGQACQPQDGVAVHAGEPLGLADAVALGEVPQDRQRRLGGQPGAEERGPLALGEAGLAGRAVEQADVLVLAEGAADGEVAGAAGAAELARGVLAAEAREVVVGHGAPVVEQG